MTLLIKNGRYTSFIRLYLMLSMSWWKEFQLLQILNDLSIKYLIKLILHENDVKLLNLREGLIDQFVKCLKCDILIIDAWKEYIKKSDEIVNLFFFCKFNVRMPFI